MKKFSTPSGHLLCLILALAVMSERTEARDFGMANPKPTIHHPKSVVLATVTIMASANPICAGTSVTFTATIASGGATPIYQWLKNGATVGTNSSTFTTSALSNQDFIQCSVSYSGVAAVMSNPITMGVDATLTVAITPNPGCTGSPLTATWTNSNESTIVWKKGATDVATDELGYALNGTYPMGTALGSDIVTDQAGNFYLSEYAAHRVTKWAPGAASGVVVAGGNGSGNATNQLNTPRGIAVDANGNLYVADYYNNRIMRWAPGATAGVVVVDNITNFGAGQGGLNAPYSLLLDKQNYLYISDVNYRVVKILAGAPTGVVVAGGNGNGAAANQIAKARGTFVADNGDLYVADANNHRVQKWVVGATSGITVAGGNGLGTAANQFNEPQKIILDPVGNLYVSDVNNHRIQKWSVGATSGVTVAGGNGNGGNANQLWYPLGMYFAENNELYVANANKETMKFALETGSSPYTPATTGSYTATVTTKYGCTNTSAAVTVNQTVTPTVSIAASANPICAGANGTFTATITDGGASPVYQWKKNNVNVGSNQNTYSNAALANNDIITCALTSNAICPNPTTVTSTPITMIINGLQTRVYVKHDATGSNNGTNWTNAYTSLQSALTSCYAANAEIWVARGTYKPSQNPTNNSTGANDRTNTFLMPNGVKLYGGFAGTESTVASRANVHMTNKTSLSGDIGVLGTDTDNTYHVVTSFGCTNGWSLEGFTVERGYANVVGNHKDWGGGICIKLSSPLTFSIKDTWVEDNYALETGGGLSIQVGASWFSADLQNCQVKRNRAKNGGGFGVDVTYDANVELTISDSYFEQNTATEYGGGLCNSWDTDNYGILTNTVFKSNQAGIEGGGIYNVFDIEFRKCVFESNEAGRGGGLAGFGNFLNCVFAGNQATSTAGGAMYGSNTVHNSTFYRNTAVTVGGALTATGLNSRNCIFWGNTAANASQMVAGQPMSYSLVEGGYTGTGNLSTAPTFVNTSDWDGVDNVWGTSDDGLQLSCGSAGLNVGFAAGAPSTDIVGTSRPQGAGVDMGAYESIAQAITPTVSIAASANNICVGTNVTFTATITNGGASPTYQWQKNAVNVGTNQNTYSDLSLSNNNVITCLLTSNAACANPTAATSNAITMTVNQVVASASAGNIAAAGGTTTLTVTASGGTTPYTYSLNGGTYQNANTFTISAGNHAVTVKDANNCTVTTATIAVSQPGSIVASASAGTILCNNGTTTLTVTASGGVGSFSYSLNGGTYQVSNLFTVSAGNQVVTVRDANNATVQTAQITVSQPMAVTASASAGTILCNNGTTNLTVMASGGTGAYTYNLNNGTFQNANTFTVSAGNQLVTVKDVNNCSVQTAQITVSQPMAVTASASAGTISCNGGMTTLTVAASGGTGAFTYSLNGATPQNGNTFTVSAGNYVVTVKDANNCSVSTASVTVSQPTAIVASASSGTILCNGRTTRLTAMASGGTGAFTYSLNNGTPQNSNAFNVSADNYVVTIRDANQCTVLTPSITVSQPALLTATVSTGAILCNGETATLTVSANGGTGAYLYRLNHGTPQNGNTFTVSTGNYVVTVTDANECAIATTSITVAQPSTIVATATAELIRCNAGTTTLTVAASGGAGAYTYRLNNGTFQNANTFTVNAGNQLVTVKDANNCSVQTAQITVSQPMAVTASASTGAILCNAGTTTLTVTASGGSGTLTYSLNNGTPQNGNTFTVGVGNYTVHVSDANQCTVSTAPILMPEPTQITVGALADPILCNGGTTPLRVGANGGTGTLMYRVNNGTYQVGNQFMVNAGNYVVTVRDANNCTMPAAPVTISEPSLIVTSASAGTILCNSGTTMLTTTAIGGTGLKTYSLNGGTQQLTNEFTVAAGTYTVTVKDANNCMMSTAAVIVTQPSALVGNASAGTISCNGGTTILTTAANGGIGNYTYRLNGGAFQANPTFTVSAGNQTVTVRDSNLCVKQLSVLNVPQPTAIAANASIGVIACNGQTTTLTVAVTGGVGNYKYRLGNGAFQNGNAFTVAAGVHHITIQDANACTFTRNNISVTEPTQLIGQWTADTVLCPGLTTILKVVATGGTGIYQYSLNQGGFRDRDTFVVSHGMHQVSVSDQNNCQFIAPTFQIKEARALLNSLVPSALNCHPNAALLCYPNPFVDNLSIEFDLTKRGDVVIEVMDLLAQSVKRFEQGVLDAGHYVSRWEMGEWAQNHFVISLLVDGKRVKWQKVVHVKH